MDYVGQTKTTFTEKAKEQKPAEKKAVKKQKPVETKSK